MDFKLFLAVVKRYKRVVISGTVLGVVLSVLSYGMPGLKGGKPTIIPRGTEVWQGDAEILISEEGFPYGRAVTQVIPGKGVDVPAQTYRRRGLHVQPVLRLCRDGERQRCPAPGSQRRRTCAVCPRHTVHLWNRRWPPRSPIRTPAPRCRWSR